jgi:hypothetical protein
MGNKEISKRVRRMSLGFRGSFSWKILIFMRLGWQDNDLQTGE